MKISAAKSLFMKNVGLYPETSQKGDSPTGTFLERLKKFSKHWFARIYICLELINNMKILLKLSGENPQLWQT